MDNSAKGFETLRRDVMEVLKETAEKGFNRAMVNSVLNMVEMNSKDQKTQFGIELTESLIGFFNYQHLGGVSNSLNISGRFITLTIRKHENLAFQNRK